MPDTPTQIAYARRFTAVLAYIDANLEGDLSVKALSQVANFSEFHFHRQFTVFVGVPVSRYVQLMRLRRAAHRLIALPDLSVMDAALDTGFDSPEAFSRAFKRALGLSPGAFRKAPDWKVWHSVFAIPHFSRSIAMQVRTVDFPEVRVAALEHRGPRGFSIKACKRSSSGASKVASHRWHRAARSGFPMAIPTRHHRKTFISRFAARFTTPWRPMHSMSAN